MNTQQTRQYEMLLRVQEFGNNHKDQFPATSPGGESFANLSAVVNRLGEAGVSKRSTTGEGRQQKKAARDALLVHLKTMSRCARNIARYVPGFDDKYKLGRLRSDQSVLMTGKTFAHEAAQSSDLFVKYGMRDTFLSELDALVEDYDHAIRTWQAGRDSQTSARANIEDALNQGLRHARTLDIFVASQLGHDSGAMAVWERGRRYDGPRSWRRARKASGTADPLPTATVPPAASGTSANPESRIPNSDTKTVNNEPVKEVA